MKTAGKKLTVSKQRKSQRAAKEQREYEALVAEFKRLRPDLLAKSSR